MSQLPAASGPVQANAIFSPSGENAGMRTLPAELVKGTTCSGGLFETAGLPARNLAAAMAAAIATSNAATAIDTVVRRDRLRHVRASRVPTARIWADSIRRRAARKST